MKKKVKLLTGILALTMILQAAPLSAMGDSAQADTYTVTESEEVNEQTSENTASAEESETATFVQSIVWQKADASDEAFDLANGGEITENLVRVTVTLAETATEASVVIDGIPVSAVTEGNQITADLELLNGSHTMTVSDQNGSETIGFTVNGDAAYPSLSIEVPESIGLGETKTFKVSCANMAEVEKVAFRLSLSKQLKVKNVQIADGVVGSYVWFRGELKFDLRVTDATALQDGTLVTFEVNAPITLNTEEEVYWNTDSAEVTLKEDSSIGQSENFIGSFDTPDVSAPVDVKYNVSGVSFAVVGRGYMLIVKDENDKAAAGISVYDENDALLGVTGTNGRLFVTFTEKGENTVYAVSESGLASARYSVTAYEPVGPEDGTPYATRYVGLVDNGKTVTWMSHYTASVGAAKIKLATAEDMSDAVTYSGTSKYTLYETTQTINRVNSVTLKDLVPDTVYYYQVGDGNVWSEVKAFTAKAAGSEINLAILGDVSGADASNVGLLANAILNSGKSYDFALQTGAVSLNMLDALGALGLDTVYTATDSEIADETHNSIFGTSGSYQSYIYGNVYVAVIHATADESELKSILNAIGEETKNSDTKWQILSIRESVYSTDTEKANDVLEKVLPDLAERAGIDLVLSGAECNFARTESLRRGEASERNGVVYVNCGSVGRKDVIVNADDFAATSDTYNALYISITATEDQLTLNVYDVQPDGISVEIDSYVRTHFVCDENDHVYRFGQNTDGLLVCEVCDHTRELNGFVGLLGMSSYYMFYDNGGFYTGWKTHNGKTYYMNQYLYVAVNGTQVIDGYTYVFKDYILVEGAWVEEEDGSRKLMWAGELLTSTWHTQAGVTYYFLDDGTMATGTVEIPTVNEAGETVVETYVFDENGALIGKQE